MFAYGTSVIASVGRVRVFVDKILKGANPGDLPSTGETYDPVIAAAAKGSARLRPARGHGPHGLGR
jgi:hypothetical protein